MQLFDVLALIVIQSLVCGTFFKIGFRTGKGQQPIAITETLKKSFRGLSKADKEQEKMRVVLENIENYDGTAKNQREVK